jgi:hypothetical protein
MAFHSEAKDAMRTKNGSPLPANASACQRRNLTMGEKLSPLRQHPHLT